MEQSNHSSSAPGAGGTGQGRGLSGVPADQTRKRGATNALTSPDRKRQMLTSALQTGALDNRAPVAIDDELLGDLLRTFSVPEAQLAQLLADTALRQHLTNIARRGLQHQGIGGTAAPQSAPMALSIDLNLTEVFNAWDSLCVLYQRLLAANATGASSAMLMAARSLWRLPPNARRTEEVVKLLEACKRLMRDSAFVKGRAEVADAYSIGLALLPDPVAPDAQATGSGVPEAWKVSDPMGNGTGIVPIAADGEWRVPIESYALSLLEAMFKGANVTLPLRGDGPQWTDATCTAVLDAYIGKHLPEEVVLTDLTALERLLRGAALYSTIPFDRYLVWHDLLRGLRKRFGRLTEGAVPALQLAHWIRELAIHEKTNRLPALVSRYLDLPVVSRADLTQRQVALRALRRLLGELDPREVPEMPEVLEKVFAALDAWDIKDLGLKVQLLVRAARWFPQADPNDRFARQTQLLNKALGYCLADAIPALPTEKALVAKLVPDLMALPATIRQAWLDRFHIAVGAQLPPSIAVLAVGTSSALQAADIAQALNWLTAPSLPVVRAFTPSISAQLLGLGPEQLNGGRDVVANDGLQFQVAAAMWLQLVRYAPAEQVDAVASGLIAWMVRSGTKDAQVWLAQMQPFVDELGGCLQRLPASQAHAFVAACDRGVGALTQGAGQSGHWTMSTGRWLLESLNGYQVALGRERVPPDGVSLPVTPLIQRMFEAWPRLRIQRSNEFMAWVRLGPISMSSEELGRYQLERGGFWGHALIQQAALVKAVMMPVQGRSA